MDRYYATTRQITGLPYIHRSYVYDRQTGKPVMACTHNHVTNARSKKPGQRLAQECAERMLRKVLAREATSAGVGLASFRPKNLLPPAAPGGKITPLRPAPGHSQVGTFQG